MFGRFLPRETSFFDFFEQHATLTVEGTKEFLTMVSTATSIPAKTSRIKELEHETDVLTHRCVEALHKTFITPIDREDIHTIAINIDKALDILNSITQKFEVYRIRSVPVNVCKFADIILEIATELRFMLKAMSEKGNLMVHIEKLHALENTADHLFHWSMADLFDGAHNPIDVLKFKEVYEHLEQIVDSIDYIGKLVRGAMVKLS